jgi:hypothetical protein
MMRKKTAVLSVAALAVILRLSFGALEYPVTEKEEIRRTVTFADPAKAKSLAVDNIFGSIEVAGGSGQEVEMVIVKTIRAKSQERLLKAKEEVILDISQDGNDLLLFVDGPFRSKEEDRPSRWKSTEIRERRHPGYEVQYDFKLKVPREIDLDIRTVTDGTIKVDNIAGDFVVRHVNGPIEMTAIAGSGKVQTVNGGVRVLFSRAPSAACSFKTINGKLEVYFPEGLKADFRLKTFNGEIYSDFPVTYLPAQPPIQERKDGKFIYKSDRFFGVRVGAIGGPEIKMDSFNGNIFINKNKA